MKLSSMGFNQHEAEVNTKNKIGSSALMMDSGYPDAYSKLKEAGAEED